MTAFPVPGNHGHWWLTTNSWNRLHAIPGDQLTWEQLTDAMGAGELLAQRAACGVEVEVTYPGVLSRYGMPRCAHCCRALGVTAGDGTPVNEKGAQRAEEAEAAIERVRALHRNEDGHCAACMDAYEASVSWPCPTHAALDQPKETP